ncbi:DUF6625 family protein [Paenibacillus glufosinatiresistens]|uniref:DUF6625 family protein n=1 Tax=Paenibacillus glufosinatiresistens TaxID=3070657 RepID=UPI00286E2B00|nr:DUF6625 family protein [Paenibacillus sp. YX.27]
MTMGEKHRAKDKGNRILLFVPYFGKLPEHFSLWLKSCEHNPAIDWLLFVDHPPALSLPPNVRIIEIGFHEFCAILAAKIPTPLTIDKPYKLCDFKPTYGFVFEEMLESYGYWGYCDIDLIFGNIRKFITDIILSECDKILFYGHLTIYRNTPAINRLFMHPGGQIDYKEILADPECRFFDEHGGMDPIVRSAGIRQYGNRIFADISDKHKQLTLVESYNYKHQVFYWEDGEVFREYLDDRYRMARRDSFAYIHFQKRKMRGIEPPNGPCSFYITPTGFALKNASAITSEDFKKYNKKRLRLVDLYIYHFNRARNKLKKLLQYA